jgi:hypothetical protein
VLQVMDSNGYLATLDVSLLFVDHLNSASGGGIYSFQPIQMGNGYFCNNNGSEGSTSYLNICFNAVTHNNESFWTVPIGNKRSLVFQLDSVYNEFGWWMTQTAGSADWSMKMKLDSAAQLWVMGGLSTGGKISVGNGNGIFPNANNNGVLGGDGSSTNYYWSSIWGNYLKYHHECTGFDALDDLALVKNYRIKTVTKVDPMTKQEYQEEVIDPESLSFLRDEAGFAEPAKDIGFLLGCIKALVMRLETLESEVDRVKGGERLD